MIFTLDIQRFIDKAKGDINTVIRKVALDLFKRVIMKTPVDTGRARGNWQVAIGSLPDGIVATEDKSGSATVSKVAAEVLAMKAGDTIYLINNLSYIRALEYGWSKQAPNGMVRTSVQEYGAIIRDATK